MSGADQPLDRWRLPLLTALSLGAGAIHFTVVGAHYAEYPPFGLLFLGLAWFQVGWALWFALSPGGLAALAAIAVNVGVVLVWAVSRTTGLPLGPEPWTAEPIGPLDALATTMELALVVSLVWSLLQMRGLTDPRTRVLSSGGAMVGGLLLVAVATSTALTMSPEHEHGPDHDHGSPTAAGSVEPSERPAPTEPSETEDVPAEPAPLSSPNPADSPTPSIGASPTPSSPTEPGMITFGRKLNPAGRVVEPVQQFAHEEVAVWVAELNAPPGGGTLRFVVVQPRPNGRDFPHWDQVLAGVDPEQVRVVSSSALSDFAHGGGGMYVMRYMRDGEILAEGVFDLTP